MPNDKERWSDKIRGRCWECWYTHTRTFIYAHIKVSPSQHQFSYNSQTHKYTHLFVCLFISKNWNLWNYSHGKVFRRNDIAEFWIAFADYCRNCLAHFCNGRLSHTVVELWFRSLYLLHKHENTGQLWALIFDVTDRTCHPANRILQLGNSHCVNLQGRSYDWLVSLASPWGGQLMRLLCTNF